VYSPPKNARQIIEAVSAVCELRYGDYDHVAWTSSPGTEQFRPLPGSNPTVGEQGELTALPSVRIEFSVPDDDEILKQVVTEAIVPNHPWESPVIVVARESEVLV